MPSGGQNCKPLHRHSFCISPWKATSRLQLYFCSRPRETVKSDGATPWLTSGPAALTSDTVMVTISGNHEGAHLESWRMFYWDCPLRPSDKSSGYRAPVSALSLSLFWRMSIHLLFFVPQSVYLSPSFSKGFSTTSVTF